MKASKTTTVQEANPSDLIEWRAKYAHTIKTEIMEELASAVGYGTRLVQHWLRDRLNPLAIEFFEACKACYDNEINGYFLSGTVLEDWYAKDWRGKQGDAPKPMQLFERALMVYDRLQKERQTEYWVKHTGPLPATPPIRRQINLDALPLPIIKPK